LHWQPRNGRAKTLPPEDAGHHVSLGPDWHLLRAIALGWKWRCQVEKARWHTPKDIAAREEISDP
jgi:hypothetical protein